MSGETLRKVLHMLCGCGAFLLYYWPKWVVLAMLFAGTGLGAFARRRQLRGEEPDQGVRRLYLRHLSKISLHRVSETPLRSGATAYAVGVGAAILFLAPRTAFVGWLVLAFGDGAATLVGRRFPIRPLGVRSRVGNLPARSLGGFLAFVGASVVVLTFGLAWWNSGFVSLPWRAIALTSVASAAFETFLPRLDDNLLLPMAAGFLFYMMS